MRHIQHIWPSVADLAADIGLAYTTVYSWVQRGRIPADYDDRLIAAASKRGAVLTREQLAKARRPRRSATSSKDAA